MKKLLGILILSLLWGDLLFAEISIPAPSNLLAKIASSTNFTSDNNNNLSSSQLNTSTSSMLNISNLKTQVEKDATALGLNVDEKALDYLTGDSVEGKTAGEYYTTGEGLNWDFGMVPEKTPSTYVYDTGLVTLSKDDNYADTNIFSNTSGAQKGQMKVYVDFTRKIMWTEIISHMTLNSKSQVKNNQT